MEHLQRHPQTHLDPNSRTDAIRILYLNRFCSYSKLMLVTDVSATKFAGKWRRFKLQTKTKTIKV